jgi:serine phosphatase RsbU (regulator of sigma subunit)
MTICERSLVAVGWAGAALEAVSGDVHVVAEFEDGVLVAVIDGLGHGYEAAVAAQAAARILASHAAEPLAALIERCHEGLRGTRGAVMSLASFDARDSRMTWAGIGNVEGLLVRGDPAAQRPREGIVLRGGIVGYHLPTVRPCSLPLSAGDTLIMATDGVDSGFGDPLPPRATAQDLADAILARHARGSDDALVLVARYVGAAGRSPADAAREGGA